MSERCFLDPERKCLGLIKATENEKKIMELEKHNSSAHERIFDRLGGLEKQEGIQVVQYEHILENLEKLVMDVNELKTKPARRWESVIEKIIEILVAAVVGFMIARIGL